MPTVRTPVSGYTGTVAGVTFVQGVGETDNPAALAYFRRHGYRIVEEPTEPPYPAGTPSQPWTVSQLKAWAAAHNVDLSQAKTKPEILDAILAEPEPEGTPEPVKPDPTT